MRFKKTKHGETRIVKKFAWVPIAIDEEWVWLEFYMCEEQWFESEQCFWHSLREWQVKK